MGSVTFFPNLLGLWNYKISMWQTELRTIYELFSNLRVILISAFIFLFLVLLLSLR